MARTARLRSLKVLLSLFLIVLAGACNLTSAPQEQLSLTEALTITPLATRTLASGEGIPTTLPITTLSVPTTQPLQFPTSISLPPTFILYPTSTPLPISIFILSPIPGNVVAGNVQVLGAAIHPQFLQYQLEYGPDPNPSNLWYPATGIVQTPVVNGLLGIWNTTVVQDSSYQLRLRVTLRDGTSLATVVNNIRIQNQLPTPIPSATPNIPRPIAAFTQDRTSGQAPLSVKFFNQSSGNISAYSWNFGDGGNSPEANPTHTFRLPGVYTVSLAVAGPGGSSNVSRQINVQSPTAPIAAFTQDKTSGPSPLTVQFTDQSTGSITAYSWNFGDGATSTDKNPSHQFIAVGTYNVILSVSGSGGTSFVTRKITVQDPVIPPPTASFAVDHNSGLAPLTVQFSNQSSGQITNYNWDFGDSITSADTNPSHIYTIPGTYVVTLTAIGPGGQNAAQISVTVNQPPNAPTAAFTENKTSGDIPLAVQFTNQSTGSITSYSWNFGDGGTSTDKDPSHTFATAGTYTVTLTVTGPGGTSSAQANITATEPIAKPKAAFTANPSTGNAPLIVQFLNQSTGESMTFNWNFGDGTPVSTDTSPTHTYATPGTYTVTLGVSNSGGTDSIQSNVTVSQAAVAPVAAFTANPTSGNVPLAVQFTNQSTGDITSYSWNFGDSGTSTDKDPSHSFATAGTFTVTLTATGPGGSNSASTTITANSVAAPPVAAFSANPTSGNAPLPVQFTNQSTGDITSYSWNFGDGGTSTDKDPAYTFANAGTFTVTLTATGNGGSNSATTTITVNPAVVPPPVAAFTANPTSGNAPLPVQFTNQSTGDITSYSWNFGDGGTSTDKDPAYTFANAGTFTVTLTATGNGGSNSTTTTITVNPAVVPPPVAAFAANPTSGNASLPVQFTNQSTGDIASYSWDFGDGGTSTDKDPAYTFANAGTFTVTLTATGNGGSNTATTTITVSPAVVPPPVAAFAANPTSGNAPLPVQFTNQSTGDIASYSWDFGDGGTSTDKDPPYTFANAGTFTVTLTATGNGGSNSATTTITVNPAVVPPPVAAFTANPTSGNAPLAVQFTNQSTGDIATYSWNFGDGGTSTDANPSYTFANAGTFTVTLTATGNGGSNSATTTITVNPAVVPPPVAAFSANPTSGNAPLAVQFTNQSTGDISSYSWNFGDGGTSTDANPSYTFANAGTFTVTLTATGNGGSNSATTTITVNPAVVPPPVAAFSANPTSGNAPLAVQFTNQSTGDIASYSWDFGDGGTSTDKDPAYTFANAGTFTVTLTATGNGGSNTATTTITVSPAVVPPPVAAFAANPTSGNAPLPVQFTNQSTGDIASYSWDFGDGGTSTDKDPAYTFANAGTFTVTLTATGNGGSNSATTTITVNPAVVPPPVVAFSANPTSGNAPLAVQFTNQSTGDIASYSWDFGDGGTSTDKDPAYTFANAGTFTVTLTATGNGGSNTSTADITVSPAAATPPPINDALVFATNRDGNNEIYLMGTDGSLTNLTNNGADDNSPAWSPDGSKIAFVTNRDGNNEIYVMNSDGSNPVNLTNNPGDDNSPAWSPDGSKIAFVTNRDGNNEVYTMSAADGSNPTNVTNNPNDDANPAVSPDGRIAFVSNRDGNSEIYLAGTDGSFTDISNNAANETDPAWSSNGQKMLFATDRDERSQVYVMNADGSNPTQLSDNTAQDKNPSWSPDESQIIFTSDRKGGSQIYVMNADGSNVTQVSDGNATDLSPAWKP